MVWYRLYFLDLDGRIVRRDEFELDDEGQAVAVATTLFDACSDECASYELWRGASRLVPPSPSYRPRSGGTAPLTEKTQALALEVEELLHNGQGRIGASKRLIARIEEMRAAKPGSEVPSGG